MCSDAIITCPTDGVSICNITGIDSFRYAAINATGAGHFYLQAHGSTPFYESGICTTPIHPTYSVLEKHQKKSTVKKCLQQKQPQTSIAWAEWRGCGYIEHRKYGSVSDGY